MSRRYWKAILGGNGDKCASAKLSADHSKNQNARVVVEWFDREDPTPYRSRYSCTQRD